MKLIFYIITAKYYLITFLYIGSSFMVLLHVKALG